MKSSRKRNACWVGLAPILLLSLTLWTWAAEEPGSYVGWKGCGGCHEKAAGDWQQSRHAKAFESLKKTGQEGLPGCIRCHVTGYEQPGGFIDYELTPALTGIQCEECHGGAKKHTAAPEKGSITLRPGIETCRRCHTPGQDPTFDYSKKVTNVHTTPAFVAQAMGEARLTPTPDHFDFGTVDEGTPATTTITLENTGNRDILITGTKTN